MLPIAEENWLVAELSAVVSWLISARRLIIVGLGIIELIYQQKEHRPRES
jgi:hypothetical protein